MSIQAVLLPVFVLVALAFGLLFYGGLSRFGAIRRREVRVADIALGQNAWPPRVTQITRAFHNQLEMPIFYYALVALVLITHKADLLFVILSWIFVAMRYAHAYVHVTNNIVPRRFSLFIVGIMVLLIMWIIFAVHIFAGV